ncbi:hypothetical protein [Methanobrevibacter millerae]|uniref:hypothetical protein n=1 Tax=Methanobrevibacter millerae TaxID=230361 RepID=UPI0026EE8F80|nr:hypothetical protein [Methanobrevibacter millerae]
MADEPVNKLYGNKIKLDFTKLGNNSKKEPSTTVEIKKENKKPVPEAMPPVEETVEEPVEAVEEVVVEETVEEPAEEEAAEKEVVEEPVVEAVEEVVEEPKEDDSELVQLKDELKEKESKLKNQSNELNYLTNTIIPDLKKENSNLKSLKVELTNALDKTSRKYYDQLDINEDLSNRIGELGADNAVSKARSDRLESELQSIRDDYEEKIKSLEVEISNLEASDVDELEKINQNLRDDLKTSNDELDDTKKQNEELRAEVDDLRKKLIEMGDYKEEVDENAKKSIDKLKDEIVSLKSELKIKQSNYDKLSNESQKTIADLRNQIERLKNDSEKKSDKGGFFDRFK